MGWSKEEDAELKRLLELKTFKCGTIAVMMARKFNASFTRNAIIGRTYRLEKKGNRIDRMQRPIMDKSVKRKAKVERQARVELTKTAATESVFSTIRAMDKPIAVVESPALQPKVEPKQKKLVEERPVVKPTPPKVKPLRNCTLQQLTDRTCKYPFGGVNDRPPYLFCGVLTLQGAPFCEHHCEVCYTPGGLERIKTKALYR